MISMSIFEADARPIVTAYMYLLAIGNIKLSYISVVIQGNWSQDGQDHIRQCYMHVFTQNPQMHNILF